MTIMAFPLDAVSSAPTYTGEMLRQALSALAGPAPAGRPLGAYSGVRPGTPNTTVTATSSTWTIGVHSGVVDLETAATAGPYWYAVRAAETGAMTPASGANDRIDLLSLVLDDPAEGDGSSTPQVRAVLTVGTPAGTPLPPAAPARSLVLAQIRVPKTGTGSPVVTWVAPWWGGDDTDWVDVPSRSGWNSNLTVCKQGRLVIATGSIAKSSGVLSNTTAVSIADLPSGFEPIGLLRTARFGYLTGGTPTEAKGFVEIAAGSRVMNMTWNQQGSFSALYFDSVTWPWR
jgi:hypothetical protein